MTFFLKFMHLFGLDPSDFAETTIFTLVRKFFKKLTASDTKKGIKSNDTVSDPHIWSPFWKCSEPITQ